MTLIPGIECEWQCSLTFNFLKNRRVFFFYLFIFGCTESPLVHGLSLVGVSRATPCGAQASHRSGSSCCRAQSLGAQSSVLKHVGSGVAVCHSREQAQKCRRTGLVARGHVESSRTDQGLNLCPLHWGGGFLSTVPPGESLRTVVLNSVWSSASFTEIRDSIFGVIAGVSAYDTFCF